MADRMLEIVAPRTRRADVESILEGAETLDVWYDEGIQDLIRVKALVTAEDAESIVDDLEARLAGSDLFRVAVLRVEAVVPRKKELEPPPDPDPGVSAPPKKPGRIGREELYADIEPTVRLSSTYVALVVLSTVVAAVGLQRDSVAIIIGAMVMAPLLGPNIALALATTLGDVNLGGRALRVNAAGVSIALLLAMVFGFLFPVDLDGTGSEFLEITSRTEVGPGDIALALAAGIAGTLAFTTGAPVSLVGVMVAVALLPPLVTVGMLTGIGSWREAAGALLLLLTNVICATFLVQGVRPRTWWEADKAKKSTRVALAIWIGLLVLLIVVVMLSQRREGV